MWWNLIPNEEENMIADAVREYLNGELPIERLRPNAAPVDLENILQGMTDLGWFGIGLAENDGGAGLGLMGELLIQRECGRQLASPTVLATTLAAHTALHARNTELLESILAGNTRASLSIALGSRADGANVKVMTIDKGENHLLLHWTDDGMGLFGSEAFDSRPDEHCLDDSVTLQRGSLAIDDPCCWVPGDSAPLSLRAQVLLAAALAGLADRASELAISYAKVREQFGKPIGSFQAVKHRCADMGVRARLSWYQTCLAGLKIEAGADDAPLQAASAKLLAAEAARENGNSGIQIHGGIGFQAECDAHWFVKRAILYDLAGGGVSSQARRIIAEPSPL